MWTFIQTKMMMTFIQTMIVGSMGGLAALTAAGFGFWAAFAGFRLWASFTRVPHDIDNRIRVLHLISKLNSFSAIAAGISAICILLVALFGTYPARLG